MKRLLFIIAFILSLSVVVRAQDQPGTVKFPGALDSAASLFEVKDNARSILAASISSTADSLTLASAASFPPSGAITIESEIIFYAGKSGNMLTGLVRGRESTAAKSHAAGVSVEVRVIAAHHNTLSTVIRAIETKLGTGASTPALDKILLGTGAGAASWTDHTLNNIKDVVIANPQTGDTLIRQANGDWTNAPAGIGTVTSVGVVMPSAIFDVSGSPVTSSGNFTITFDNQSANNIFAGPTSGGAAAPGFRQLVSDDIPELALGTKTSGNYVASVATAGPLTGGAAGSEGAAITLNCPTCVLSSMAGTANEIASTGGTAPVLSIPSTFDLTGKTDTMPVRAGTTLPGTCTANKSLFIKTNPSTPGQQLYVCNATGDGWNLVGDGGGAGSISSLNGQTGASQTFSKTDDANVTLTITSATNDHGFALGWTGQLAAGRGGTGNAFTQFSGPATSVKTFTLPNASATILTTNDLVTITQGGTGANSASGARSSLGLVIGTDVQAFDVDLAALAGNAVNGLYARTGDGTGTARTLTGTSNQVVVTNGDGVSGNPTFSTPQDIHTGATPQFARLGLGAAADANHLLNLALGTITTDKHAIEASATWNAGGVTFTGWKLNVTDTASAAGSLLMDLQVGGVSKAKVDKAGNLTVTSCAGCGGAPGGSDPQVQYKSGSSLAGATNFTITNNNPRLVSSAAPGSPNNGELWYDSTQKTETLYVEGLKTYRTGGIFVATAAKTTTNTTTATTMFGTGVGSTTLPANFFVPGRVIRLRFGGTFSTNSTNQTIQFLIKLGSTTVFNGNFSAAPVVSGNGEPWWAEAIIVCRTTGTSGTVTSQMILYAASDTGTKAMTGWGLGSQMTQTTINTTVSQALDAQSKWDFANASNIWTTNWSYVEIFN
ncbi:MAG: hypothetical protein AB1631_28880 [Acidobacteriota bacterium]